MNESTVIAGDIHATDLPTVPWPAAMATAGKIKEYLGHCANEGMEPWVEHLARFVFFSGQPGPSASQPPRQAPADTLGKEVPA